MARAFHVQYQFGHVDLAPSVDGIYYLVSQQDNLKEEEKLKKELRLRMAYAGFLQETVTAMAVKKKTRYKEAHLRQRPVKLHAT